MDQSSEMLTQEAIDSLIGKSVTKKAPDHVMMAPAAASKTQTVESPSVTEEPVIRMAPHAPMPSKPAVHSGNHEECIAAGEIQTISAKISEILARLSKLEVAVAKHDGKGALPNDMSLSQLKTTVQQMKNIGSQVEVISEGLRGTAGYNLNKTFKCSSCQTVGIVSIKVKCNQCGQENWWGWWPKKK